MGNEIEPRRPGFALEIREPVTELLKAIGGSPPAEESGAWIGDFIRGRRARTQIKVLEKTLNAIEAAQLPVRVVPAKTLVPLLDFAGLEDEADEDMTARWANLLANAATTTEIPAAYPSILAQLESIEAHALDFMVGPSDGPSWRGTPEGLEQEIRGATATNIDNLLRLELVRLELMIPPVGGRQPNRDTLGAMALGAQFVSACRPPRRSPA